MKVAIAGGTGFVGRALTEKLVSLGHHVYILSRRVGTKPDSDGITYVPWLHAGAEPEKSLVGIDAFVNLAGESINSGRWTEARKKRILDSRLEATEEVLRILRALEKKPAVLINASAVGYYGTSLVDTFVEDDTKKGNDFLAKTVQEWEAKAQTAVEVNVPRVVLCRFGIILDKHDGALVRIALPYRFFVGGTVGSGEQILSWIHLDDVVGAIIFAIEHPTLSGPVNFTAPNPVTMKEFGKALGSAMHRPHWLPAPGFALKAVLGDMSILVLEGQKVLPAKLQEAGYVFHFSEVGAALGDIYNR